jgi:hypothetical protein
VLAGLTLGWITHHYYPVNDYWDLNEKSILEYNTLILHPVDFITNIGDNPYHNQFGRFFNSVGSYWNDLRNNIIIKILAICNLISHGNYYINSLFFNFFSFCGLLALYKVFVHVYANKKNTVMICVFLLPSTLYFTSGIHKDLLVAAFLAFYTYALYFIINDYFSWKRFGLLIFSGLMILLLRNFLFFAIIPASFAYWFSVKYKISSFKVIITSLSIAVLMLWISENFFNYTRPLEIIEQRSYDFLQLGKAGSQIEMNDLKPTLKSYLANIPQVIDHVLLRPYFWEKQTLFSWFLSVELFFYWVLLIVFLFQFYRGRQKIINSYLNTYSIFMSILMLLMIGYIVPNVGSIVRYRSIYLPYLITPILCNINLSNKVLRYK